MPFPGHRAGGTRLAPPIKPRGGTPSGGKGGSTLRFSGGEASWRAGGRHGWRAAAQVGVALAGLRDDTALDDVALTDRSPWLGPTCKRHDRLCSHLFPCAVRSAAGDARPRKVEGIAYPDHHGHEPGALAWGFLFFSKTCGRRSGDGRTVLATILAVRWRGLPVFFNVPGVQDHDLVRQDSVTNDVVMSHQFAELL